MKKFMTLLVCCCFASSASASEAQLETVKVSVDVQTVARGVDAVMNSCHSCHSLKYIKYHDLVNFGIDKSMVDTWRGDQPMDSAMLAQMSDSDAVQAYGKAPPDLSLMAKARDGGASYVYSYLLGYYITPEGMPGNHIYPATKMPDILGISGITDEAGRAGAQGKAHDIVSFLAWAADPDEQARHKLGYYVLGYLFVLTCMLYLVKNQIWSRLK